MEKPNSFMKKSLDAGCNKSPLDQDRIHVGMDDIRVKLIGYPDETMMRQVIAKQVLSTAGSDVDRDLDPAIAEELFRGGLQTGLEAFTLIFEVSGISRQLTHELVRTRKAVFHQQSFRWTDLGNHFNVRMPETIMQSEKVVHLADYPILERLLGSERRAPVHPHEVFRVLVYLAREAYAALKEADLPYQDCRCVCPIGTETYIICSYPISEFLATYAYRACRMMLHEYQFVMKLMREEVLKIFPWMEPHIKISCEKMKRCSFQGWESTEHCDLPWAKDRVYKPNYELLGLRGKVYGTADQNKSQPQ